MTGKSEKSEMNSILRELPSVDSIAQKTWFSELEAQYSRPISIRGARATLEQLRKEILAGKRKEKISEEELLEHIRQESEKLVRGNFRKVINGTGVVLHTNLGRAPLCKGALERIREVAEGYSNLEFNLEDGVRGSRHSIVESLICELTGAEGALVVNNNAAAVTLVLSELVKEKEVVVSRGQLVEIGGSFRVPDVMAESGAFLKEVGTTNKTKLSDYRNAMTELTGAFMKIHTSNFKICGFTEEVDSKEMTDLAKECGVLSLEDLGSGCLVDLSVYGLPKEPTVQEAIASGMDIVTFSGDKLLGGPQAGIIAGKKEYIERIKRHPMARAFRMDKLTLAALEGTLLEYRNTESMWKNIPTLRMLTAEPKFLWNEGLKLKRKINRETGEAILLELMKDFSEVGGGSLPLHKMETAVLALSIPDRSPDDMAMMLRTADTAIVGRISKDRFLIDMRTVLPEEYDEIVKMLKQII